MSTQRPRRRAAVPPRTLPPALLAGCTALLAGLFLLLPASPVRAEGRGIIVIHEIMYHPSGDDRNLEYVELYNATPAPIDLSGWFFSNGIEFTFPDGTWLDGKRYLVVCANEDAVRETYGIENTMGNWGSGCDDQDTGRGCALDNGGERLELAESNGVVHASLRYNDRGGWPGAADGTGHSLEMVTPYRPQGHSASWRASGELGGSPGRPNSAEASRADDPPVVVNEGLLLTEGERWVELFNRSVEEVDVSGWYITDTRGELRKAQLPAESTIPGRGWLTFSESDLGLDLSPISQGPMDDARRFVALSRPLEEDELRVVNAYVFEPRAQDMSEARFPDGSDEFSDRATPTPGAANEVPVERDVVFNELMYHPIDNNPRAEYIELYNRGDEPVDLTGWRVSGGVDFDFPDGVVIPADGYLVVAKDPQWIRETYGLTENAVVGPAAGDTAAIDDFGNIGDDGERINLRDANDNLADVLRYHDGGKWPDWADGGGSSLELVDPWQDNNAPGAWDSSDDSAEAEVVEHVYQGRLGAAAESELRLILLGPGITVIDDLRMFERTTTFQPDRVILDTDTEWRYFKGREAPSDPPDAWRDPDFDDSSWSVAPAPIGYNEDGIVTELEDMRGEYISVFFRKSFVLEDPESMNTPLLEVRFDDGFLVWLNGELVVDERTGNMRDTEPAFDDRARSSREGEVAEIDLSEFRDHLVAGENTLAFEVHNSSTTSADFFFSARLLDGEFVNEDGPNLVANGDFEEELERAGRPGGWFIEGTHVNSGRTGDDPITGSSSLKLVATNRGDNKVNRLETTLPRLDRRAEYTISFKTRWVIGSQTLLTQGYSHGFPHSHSLGVPRTLGTPGRRNSTAVENSGPIIQDVSQDPGLPRPGEDTAFVARATDPDGVAAVRLLWSSRRPVERDDPALNEIVMDGPDAAGRWHAQVPGGDTREVIVCFIEAEDSLGNVGRYPPDPLDRTQPTVLDVEDAALNEHSYIVYRHDRPRATQHLSYRFWMHQLDEIELSRRRLHSNKKVQGTFVFENRDVYWGANTRFSGSPFARQAWGESMRVLMPKDAPLHGAIKKFNMEDHQGSGGRDARERISHYLIRHNQGSIRVPHATPWLVQWQVNDRVNGIREHAEVPSGEMIERFYPEDDEGYLFEIDDRHVFNDAGGRANSIDARLTYPPYAAQASQLGLERDNKELYRWYFNMRTDEPLDDYSELIELAKLLTPTVTPDPVFDEKVWEMMDVEEFLRIWSIRMNTDDWDTWGTRRGKNAYLYHRPNDGRWVLIPWDMELTYGNVGAFMPGPITQTYNNNFAEVNHFINRPRIKRMYYGIMAEMLDHQFNSRFLATYMQKLQRRGLAQTQVGRPNGFIDQRARRLENVLRSSTRPAVDLEVTTNGGEPFSSDAAVVEIEGRAPVEIFSLVVAVNGEEYDPPLTAEFSNSNPLGWSARVPLSAGENRVSFFGFGSRGNPVGSTEITVTFSGDPPAIESVEPSSVFPGETVTIRGSGLYAGIPVLFGDRPAAAVDESGLPEELVATVPEELPPGTVDVRVGPPEGPASEPFPIEVLSSAPEFLRGDADGSGHLNISDAAVALLHLFNAVPIPCEDAADVDDDGALDLTDGVVLLEWLFRNGPQPEAPFPEPGSDPTEDGLTCETGL